MRNHDLPPVLDAQHLPTPLAMGTGHPSARCSDLCARRKFSCMFKVQTAAHLGFLIQRPGRSCPLSVRLNQGPLWKVAKEMSTLVLISFEQRLEPFCPACSAAWSLLQAPPNAWQTAARHGRQCPAGHFTLDGLSAHPMLLAPFAPGDTVPKQK